MVKKNKVGRPKVKESAKSETVSIKPTDKKKIVNKYGSLTNALKALLRTFVQTGYILVVL